MGDLAFWMDENFLQHLFGGGWGLRGAKIIRNRSTGLSEGYGFLEFHAHADARRVLQAYNGHQIPGTDQVFRLNWAAHGVGQGSDSREWSVFVGDLAPDVTDYTLQEFFRNQFASVRSAKVVTDAATGRPKGYGFVRFGSEQERDASLQEMNGQNLSTRTIRVSLATPKRAGGRGRGGADAGDGAGAAHGGGHGNGEAGGGVNTTLFIGALSSNVSEEALAAAFQPFGEIVYTKIPPGRSCGFVQFVRREAAQQALLKMNGQVMGESAIRISWGKHSGGKRGGGSGGGPHAGGLGTALADFGAAYGGVPPFDPAVAGGFPAGAQGAPMGYYVYDPATGAPFHYPPYLVPPGDGRGGFPVMPPMVPRFPVAPLQVGAGPGGEAGNGVAPPPDPAGAEAGHGELQPGGGGGAPPAEKAGDDKALEAVTAAVGLVSVGENGK